MKSGINNIVLLFSLLLASEKTSASHLMGADLSYVAISDNSYRITLKVYRDCNGINLSLSTPLQVTSPKSSLSVNLNMDLASVIDITNLCSGTASVCQGGNSPYGIEEYTFVTIFNRAVCTNCCIFNLSWTQAARNKSITTLLQSQDFYTYAVIDVCKAPKNNSPQIPNKPVAFMCPGNDIAFNNGVMDTLDGDSISYMLADPLKGWDNPCTFMAGFDKIKPLVFFGFPDETLPFPQGFHLDPASGDLTFRPLYEQIAVIVIQVTEWRKIKGVYEIIGETRRDMQIIVTGTGACNTPPVLPPVVTRSVCVGEKLTFDIVPADLNSADSVTIRWNSGIAGASFTTGGGKIKQGTFSWIPTFKDTSSKLYYFTVTATDNACPFKGSSSKAYSVKVNPSPYVKIHAPDACFPDSNEFTDLSSVANGTADYRQWSIGDGSTSDLASFKHRYSDFTKYEVKLRVVSNAGCTNTLTQTVKFSTNAIAGYDVIPDCGTLTNKFINTSHVKGGEIRESHWDFGDGDASVIYSPDKTYAKQGMYKVRLAVNSNEGCRDTIDKMVAAVSPVAGFAVVPVACEADSVQFVNISDCLPQTTYQWYFSDESHSDRKDPLHKFPAAGNYSVSLRISSFGCTDSIHKADVIKIDPSPKAGFNAMPDSTSILTPFIKFSNSSQGAIKYQWDFDENSKGAAGRDAVYEFTAVGDHWVSLVAENEFGCSDLFSRRVHIENVYFFFVPNSFSPNGDQVNDVFKPEGMGIANYSSTIFNRWGEKVFEGEHSANWNGGNFNQLPAMQEGLYLYQFRVTDFKGREFFYSGTVHLLK